MKTAKPNDPAVLPASPVDNLLSGKTQITREGGKRRIYPQFFEQNEIVAGNKACKEISDNNVSIDESRTKNTIVLKPTERGTGHIPGVMLGKNKPYQLDDISVLKGLVVDRKKPGEYGDELDCQETIIPSI